MPIGEIRLFAGIFAPLGWEFCEGQTLSVREHAELHFRMGNKFGGDGQETFALPDLRGRAPMHFGSGINIADERTIALDAPGQWHHVGAKLNVNYIILLKNLQRMDEGDAFVSEIRIFAGNHASRGWLPCDGRWLRIFDHTALFSLLGAKYSERFDPQLFSLPNLQSRMPIHPRTQDELGMTANALAYSDAAPKMTHLPLGFYIAVDGVYPSRP